MDAVGVPLDGTPCDVVVGLLPALSGVYITLALFGIACAVVGIGVHLALRKKT